MYLAGCEIGYLSDLVLQYGPARSTRRLNRRRGGRTSPSASTNLMFEKQLIFSRAVLSGSRLLANEHFSCGPLAKFIRSGPHRMTSLAWRALCCDQVLKVLLPKFMSQTRLTCRQLIHDIGVLPAVADHHRTKARGG